MIGRLGRAAWVALSATLAVLGPRGASGEGTAALEAPPGRTETEERDGAVVGLSIFDPSGALIEESRFGPDGLVETRTYIRSSGKLRRVEAKGPDGEFLGALDYRYDGRGRLLALIPSGSLGSGTSGMIASGPSPSGVWAADGSTLTVQRLDVEGRPLRIEVLREGKPVSRRTYSYAEGMLPRHAEEEDLAAGIRVVSDFNEGGRILLRTEYFGGTVSARTEYDYDAQDRLVETRSRLEGALLVKSFSYDESGSLAREETRTDGIISGAVEYRGDLRLVERYYEGLLFARTTYTAGRKIKDEFFDEGVLIRAKDYQ